MRRGIPLSALGHPDASGKVKEMMASALRKPFNPSAVLRNWKDASDGPLSPVNSSLAPSDEGGLELQPDTIVA
jgi:hypothetical protein